MRNAREMRSGKRLFGPLAGLAVSSLALSMILTNTAHAQRATPVIVANPVQVTPTILKIPARCQFSGFQGGQGRIGNCVLLVDDEDGRTNTVFPLRSNEVFAVTDVSVTPGVNFVPGAPAQTNQYRLFIGTETSSNIPRNSISILANGNDGTKSVNFVTPPLVLGGNDILAIGRSDSSLLITEVTVSGFLTTRFGLVR